MVNNPLIQSTPKEVPLKASPLIRVIAQVSFPTILSINDSKFVAPFQESIRQIYPILRSEQEKKLTTNPQGIIHSNDTLIWRFLNTEGNWRVSLAPSFIALETTEYLSRTDFLERLKKILVTVDNCFNPQSVDRLGLRYIDRITGQNIANISKLVRPEIAGILATEMIDAIELTINESILKLDLEEAKIRTRWGLLSPLVTIDPAAIEPIEENSWILDLDIFKTDLGQFQVEFIIEKSQQLAERLYTFFRWAVTDQFLNHFGGELEQ